jgi:hypothetical protein
MLRPRTPLAAAIAMVCVAVVAWIGWKVVQTSHDVRRQVVPAQQSRVAAEQEELRLALEEFRNRNINSPPAGNSPQEIQRQFRLMFFRYSGDPVKELAAEGLAIDQLDDAEKLVFWLGGLREQRDSKKLIGFSSNPEAPFDRSRPGQPLFKFDPERLVDRDGDQWWEYQTPPVGDKRGVYELGPEPPRLGRRQVLVAE